MKFVLFFGVIALTAFLVTYSQKYVAAADAPTVLILSETADMHSTAIDDHMTRRVIDAMSNQLITKGFHVVDRSTAKKHAYNRKKTDQLMDEARSISRPTVDVALIFSIHSFILDQEYSDRFHIRLSGRLVDVRSGLRLGNFEVSSPDNWYVAKDCNRACLIEQAGAKAKSLSQELSDVLGNIATVWFKAGHGNSSNWTLEERSDLTHNYVLIFDNISVDEYHKICDYLVAFKGYKKHRTLVATLNHHEVWYETQSGTERLTRNLQKLLNRIGIIGRVVYPKGEVGVFGIEKLPFDS